MARGTFTFEGKRYDITANTEKELIEKIALRKRDLEEGRTRITKNMLVSVWAREWCETYKKGIVSDDWCKSITSIINTKIVPHIGSAPLKNIKQIHIQKLLIASDVYSATYITKIYNVLHEMFDTARRNGLILENPVEGAQKPSGKRPSRRRSIAPQERRYILSLCNHHRGGPFYKIMLYCGLRPGEVAALQWRCIDLRQRKLKVDCALKADGTIGDPKSAAGFRTVFIPSILISDLAPLKGEPYDYVCTQSGGERHTDSSLRQMWTSFKYRLNIEMGCRTFKGALVPPYRVADDLIPYCFRHTYCTDLQAAGIPINVARELMGHEDISTTSAIYTHSSIEAYESAAEAADLLHEKRNVGMGVGAISKTVAK